ncbi:MAG: BMP family ABC transporter substrate-binding protein, partial [Chloroflexi bacterium]|nr:BMP family ABC transporter substrate-binding protein [Chloroflexota bacterium]
MKRQWFRLLGLVCALSFVFTALMGCSAAPASSTGSTASTDESQPAQKTRVAFVSYMAIDSAEWLQNLAKGLQEYQENHPNIEIKLVEATQPNEYEPKVRALAVDGYDIIITSYDTMAAATV